MAGLTKTVTRLLRSRGEHLRQWLAHITMEQL